MGLTFEGPTIKKLVKKFHQTVAQGTTDLQALKTEFRGLQENIEATLTE